MTLGLTPHFKDEGGITMRIRDEQGMMAIGVALMLIVVLPHFLN